MNIRKYLRIGNLTTTIITLTHLLLFADSKIDSFHNELISERDPKTRTNLNLSIANEYRNTNADSAIKYSEIALAIALQIHNFPLIAIPYYNKGVIEATRNNYEEALINCDSAFKYFLSVNDTLKLGLVRNVQGGVNMVQGKNVMALNYYFDAIKFMQHNTDSITILITYNNIVILLNAMNKPQMALEYAVKQYNWATKIKNRDEIAYACGNIIDTYNELNSFPRTKKYVLELSELAKTTEDPYLKVIALNQTGTLHLMEHDFTKAIINYNQSLELNANLIDQQLFCQTLINLATAYKKANQLAKSDSCLLKAVEISKEIEVKEELASAYKELSNNAIFRNDYKTAFEYATLYQETSEMVLNEKSQAALIDAESSYKFDENNRLIESLNREKQLLNKSLRKHRLIQTIMMIFGIMLLVFGFLVFNQFRLRKTIENQQALLNERKRISADLHDDIGSTLGSISMFSKVAENRLKKNENAEDVVSKIGIASREMIEKMSDIIWSISPDNDSYEQLINRMKSYASMMLFPKDISFHFEVDEKLLDRKPAINERKNIFLIFKEALHNTIKHGDAQNVFVKMDFPDKEVRMEISDDGNGFNLNRAKVYNGNGLKNMKARASEMKGGITFHSVAEEGTSIRLNIPA